MNAINPLVMPHNHQVERVIQAAIEGDLLSFEQLQPALQPPYELLPGGFWAGVLGTQYLGFWGHNT